jgi:hypothetical protein
MGGRNLDARTPSTVNTPAMVAKIPGKGSQYALSFADDAGNPFDGRKSYRLNVPANAPAKDFWSVVLYDPQTRSELQTGQPFPSKNNKRDKMIVNADGSVDIYFGPEAPEGKEATGFSPSRARAGLRSSAFTARSSPGSTKPGAPERLKR